MRAAALAATLLLASCVANDNGDDASPFSHEKPATITHESGLLVEDLTLGAGTPVPPGAVVTVEFTAFLPNGAVFDSTDTRGGSVTWPLARMIRGWREGVPGMRVGGTRRIEVPSDLAYGAYGRPPHVPPHADLAFEITLLSFERP